MIADTKYQVYRILEWGKILYGWMAITATLISTVEPMYTQQNQVSGQPMGGMVQPGGMLNTSGMMQPGGAMLPGGGIAQPMLPTMGQMPMQTPAGFAPGIDPTKQFIAAYDAGLGTELELSIRVANLPEPNTSTGFAPMCVTSIQQLGNTEWMEVHRTEAVANNVHPEFTNKPVISYSFGEKQSIRFKIINSAAVKPAAPKGPKTAKDDTAGAAAGAGGAPKAAKAPAQDKEESLGFAECNLGELIHRGRMNIKLRQNVAGQETTNSNSQITIVAEKLIGNNDEVKMVFSGTLTYPADTYIQISRIGETTDKSEVVVKTEIEMTKPNPSWKPILTTVRNLCNGNYNRLLRITVSDWGQQRGQPQCLGEFQTTLYELQNLGRRAFVLPTATGTINLTEFSIVRVPTFADFIRGGLRINCFIAIDFTAHNGDKNTPGTLHYLEPTGTFNQYEEALHALVSILEDYDSDRRFPVYGFGAETNQEGGVRYNFNVNPMGVDCIGTDGVLQAYRTAIRNVTLSSPGLMSPTITKVKDLTKTIKPEEAYNILLVLTQGTIEDFAAVEAAITNASDLPLSIIIVGIGSNASDFAEMRTLDADHLKEKLGAKITPAPAPTTAGAPVKPTRRDIVQFIKFNQFRSTTTTAGIRQNAGSYLAKQVLAEVPVQLVSFMRSKNIAPKPPIFQQAPLPGQPLGQPMLHGANPYANNAAHQGFPGGAPPHTGMHTGMGATPTMLQNPTGMTPTMSPNPMSMNPAMSPGMGLTPNMGMTHSSAMPHQGYTSMEVPNVYPPPQSGYGSHQGLPGSLQQYSQTGMGVANLQQQFGQLGMGTPQHQQQLSHLGAGGAQQFPNYNQTNPGMYPPHMQNPAFPNLQGNMSQAIPNTSAYSGYPHQPNQTGYLQQQQQQQQQQQGGMGGYPPQNNPMFPTQSQTGYPPQYPPGGYSMQGPYSRQG